MFVNNRTCRVLFLTAALCLAAAAVVLWGCDGGDKPVSESETERADYMDSAVGIDMVFVKGGTFKMGCTTDTVTYRSEWVVCADNEEPAHNVTVGDFYIGRVEVTQKQWTAVMKNNPSAGAIGDDLPVNNVSWKAARKFIKRLNAMTGKMYRLPTEAEWEYAARGGGKSEWHIFAGGGEPYGLAWYFARSRYNYNSDDKSYPVGINVPNELGIHDMSGNVWEWVNDRYGKYRKSDAVDPAGPVLGFKRVLRGGGWGNDKSAYRVETRTYESAGGNGFNNAGFRLALSPRYIAAGGKRCPADSLNDSTDSAAETSGTFTDPRDCQKYRTVTIEGKTWMAENLNYQTSYGSWCYGDSPDSCDKYGRLYTWGTAMYVCPSGWHVASADEWDNLYLTARDQWVYEKTPIRCYDVSGKSRFFHGLSNTDGKGTINTDNYGFSALPGGVRYAYDNEFRSAGIFGVWWVNSNNAYKPNRYMHYDGDIIGYGRGDYRSISDGYSVRCVKDFCLSECGGAPVMDMVFVKGGTFKMGCADEQKGCEGKEEPAHKVTLGDFHIGKYEVTQKQWFQVMKDNPSIGAEGKDLPVNNVVLYQIHTFIERLNAMTGKKYRLPTEAEWEYAARGGAQSKGYIFAGSDNPDDVAWQENNSDDIVHPVGTKAPNELGIYDMSGNVWERVSDFFRYYHSLDDGAVNPKGPDNGYSCVIRGGSWNTVAKDCRVSNRVQDVRYNIRSGFEYFRVGFRLASPP